MAKSDEEVAADIDQESRMFEEALFDIQREGISNGQWDSRNECNEATNTKTATACRYPHTSVKVIEKRAGPEAGMSVTEAWAYCPAWLLVIIRISRPLPSRLSPCLGGRL